MNIKTTLTLLVLAGAGVLLWWYGSPPLPPALNPTPPPAPVADKGTREYLDSLQPDKIESIQVRAPSGTTELTHKADGQWSLPGNWPLRRREVENLVGLLTNLRSRFQPQPLDSDKELKALGLEKPAVTVVIRSDGEEHTLAFGEPPTENLENRSVRDTYVRLGKKKEAMRLAPGLIAALDRPIDYYQERRLFEKDRTAEKTGRDAGQQLRADRLTIEDKKPKGAHFTLVRTGKTWKEAELAEPVRDRLDDQARKALLDGILDLWAEKFVPVGGSDTPSAAGLFRLHLLGDSLSAATDIFFATQGGLLVRAGLNEPERVITARDAKGNTVTLQIGGVAGKRQRMVLTQPPPGMPPGMQPRPQLITEEFRYARLQDNGQVFEIRADKLRDVFVSLDTLRNSRVADFKPADARKVEIKHGGEDIVLEKEKEKDNWKITRPLQADADNMKVNDLLNKLAELQARDKDVLDKEDPNKYGFDKPEAVVVITVEEEVKGEDRRDAGAADKKEKKTRTLTVRVGKHDADKKKLYVMSGDYPRINAVEDSLEPLITRSALAYRGKRLLDFNAGDAARIAIDNEGKKLTLERGSDGWRLTTPVKAETDVLKVDQLLTDLGRLEAAEYVSAEPKKDELESQYGLGKPPLTVRIEFTDGKKPAQVLHVGKARSGKGGFFARLADGGPVFAITDELHKQLARDALSYRPSTLWQALPDEVASLRVQKQGQKEYTLTRSGSDWHISGPFEATAISAAVQQMTTELGSPRVESYTSNEAKDLAEYGLDKPAVTVRVQTKDGKEHTLLIGKPAAKEAGLHYAKLADDAAIFTIGEAIVRAADHAALDLLDTRLLHLKRTDVERVRSQAGDRALTLEKKGDAWQVTESPAGAYPADREAMASLSLAWSDLRAERFADYGKDVDWAKYGLDKPAVRVTLSAGKNEHVIELGKPVEEESGARYARVEKGAGVAVLPVELAPLLERTYLDYVNHDLLNFEGASVAAFQRHMGTKVLEVVTKDGQWQLEKPVQQKADDPTMQQLFEQVGHLRAERVAAYPAGDLKSFGLDTPTALLTIKLQGDRKPSEHIIKLGKPAGDGGGRFALVDEGKAVAVLSASLVQQLTGSPLTFRDRAVARFGNVDRLQLQRGPRSAVFSDVEGAWKLTEPVKGEVEQDQLEDLIGRLSRLRAAALVAEKPDADDLKKYGLDHPEASWRVQSSGKEVLNLLVGNKEEKGQRRYAKLAKGDLVFLLDPRLSQKVLDEYRPRIVWTMPLDALQIEALNYRYQRNPFVLEKTESGWQAVGKPDAKVNAATVEDTLATLAGLKLSRYAVDKDANLALFGLDKPELILELATRTGKRVLHVGNVEGSAKGRYARIPEPGRSDVFVLDEATCHRLMRDLSAFERPPERSSGEPASR